jgi:beta-phosphoglucomutase-like phosphatase (HAD superfamily)
MDLHYVCWSEVLAREGKSIDKANFLRLEGSNIRKLMASLVGSTDTFLLNKLIHIKDELFAKAFAFNLYPGVGELISFLVSNNISIGIVTASSSERFHKTIPTFFIEKFDCIVTGDDLTAGKPSPEVYLEGAKRLSLTSDRILVVENAPLGVESALSAGMRCCVVGNTLPQEEFPTSVEYFETNMDLFRGIKSEFEKSSHCDWKAGPRP